MNEGLEKIVDWIPVVGVASYVRRESRADNRDSPTYAGAMMLYHSYSFLTMTFASVVYFS